MTITAHPFRSTSARGLDRTLFPFRLWEKAKRLGVWDPAAIDFTRDRHDWLALRDDERAVLLHVTALFQGGEESVTRDLLPLIRTIAREGRLEEEMYLTSFLWEEAKHVEVFRRFLDEVADTHTDLGHFHGPNYRALFLDALPAALDRLEHDASPEAQAEASVTYNLVVEGVLAETGYHAYHDVLDRHGILPGMREAVGHLTRDEARHLAYGVYLLSRLVAEHGERIQRIIERRMEALLPIAIGIIPEVFAAYHPTPFGLAVEHFTGFAMQQFQHRLAHIGRARGAPLDAITHAPLDEH